MFKNKALITGGIVGMGYWIYSINQHKKTLISSNTLFKSLVFHVKSSPKVLELLGKIQNIPISDVKGDLNIIKGICDITFLVQGQDNSGIVRFKGRKISEQEWKSEILEITPKLNVGAITSYEI